MFKERRQQDIEALAQSFPDSYEQMVGEKLDMKFIVNYLEAKRREKIESYIKGSFDSMTPSDLAKLIDIFRKISKGK